MKLEVTEVVDSVTEELGNILMHPPPNSVKLNLGFVITLNTCVQHINDFPLELGHTTA